MDPLLPKEKGVIAVELILYIFGTSGNLVVIFTILYLGEHKKTTHWYMLQLAMADIIYLQALPFAVSDLVHDEWIYSPWLCRAKQAVKFINYYGSVLFLMIMAVDRYLAVCYGLSRISQKLRSPRYCYTITAVAWTTAILLCVPVMTYSEKTRRGTHCQCRLEFPTDAYEWCSSQYSNETGIEICVVKKFDDYLAILVKDESCDSPELPLSSGDLRPSNYGSGDSEETFLEYLDSDDVLQSSPSGSSSPDQIPYTLCRYDTLRPGFATFIYANFVAMFIIPVIVIMVCYGLIIAQIRKTTYSTQRRPKEKMGKNQTRVTMMCGVLVTTFVACWLPFHALHLAKIKGFRSNSSTCDALNYAIDIFVYANSAVNPYLYNFLCSTSNRFRDIWKHKRTDRVLTFLRLSKLETGITEETPWSKISRIPTQQNTDCLESG